MAINISKSIGNSPKKAAESAKAKVAESATKVEVAESATSDGYIDPNDVIRHSELVYRERFDEEEMEALQESITVNGLIHPVNVWVDGDKTYLVAGERRIRAIRDMEEATYNKVFPNGVPYRVIVKDVAGAKLVQAAENLSRKDITSYEVALTINSLVESGVKTLEIAQAIGKSGTYVRDYIRFMREASDALKESLRDGDISFDDALNFMKLTEEEQEEKISKLKDVAKNAETKKQQLAAKKEVVSSVKEKSGNPERATKADLIKLRDVLKEEALSDEDNSPKYTRAMLFYATSAACEFALGLMSVDDFVDTVERVSIKYQAARTDYEKE